MLIDAQAPMQLGLAEQADYICKLEDMGFDGVGLADHMEHGRDVYAALAFAAARTSRVSLFPCVSNPVTRHPWVLANVAHSLEELAPGRFRLVIGAGDTAVAHIGRKPAKVSEMRDAVVSIRKLLRGERVTFEGHDDDGIIGAKEPAPPVAVAAGGTKMTELAGEVGDEAFLLAGVDPAILAMVQRHLKAGAARSGRSLDGFQTTHYTLVRIDEDEAAAREFIKARVFGWIKAGFFRAALPELGIQIEDQSRPEDLPAAAVEKLCDSVFLAGPAAKIRDRLQMLSGCEGFDRVVAVISGPERGGMSAVEVFAKEILPKVK